MNPDLESNSADNQYIRSWTSTVLILPSSSWKAKKIDFFLELIYKTWLFSAFSIQILVLISLVLTDENYHKANTLAKCSKMGWREKCVTCMPTHQEDQTWGEKITCFKSSICVCIWHTSQSHVPDLETWLNIIIHDKEGIRYKNIWGFGVPASEAKVDLMSSRDMFFHKTEQWDVSSFPLGVHGTQQMLQVPPTSPALLL